MKLSDIMGAANLSFYAEVGLVLFMAVFVAVTVRVFWPGQAEQYEALGRIPLGETNLAKARVTATTDIEETN